MTSAMGGDASRGMNGGTQQGERLHEAASGLVDQAARTAEAQASTTMTKVGETLSQVADAIREAGNGLRENQPQIAGFVDTAASRVEDASTYLQERDASEVVENVQRMARQNPAVIVGGGLALGLLLGRVLRSGASGGQESQMQPYGSTGYGSTGYGSTGYGSTDYTGGALGATGYGDTAGSAGYAGASDYGTAGVGIAATDTLGDTAGSSFLSGTSGAGADLGAGSDVDLSDDFASTDTMTVTTDDILDDDTDADRGR